MKKLLLLHLLLSSSIVFSQYNIGSTTLTFNDPGRTGGFGSGGGPGRQIQCEIYYPATSTGTGTPIATGEFPVIVFGHGFVMSWDAYQNIWERLVPEGYIMVFPRTEGSFSPSHTDFGLDLAQVEQKMQNENTNTSSIFYTHVKNRSAIMGHSMGGGSTVLAADGNSNIKTIVCLAPAETSPSAITAAAGVTVPALVMSGSEDGVTPPVDHHEPIYDAMTTGCKTFISITGGAHCYFANSNLNCDFGEATSSFGISITRAQQQDISEDMYSIWFDFYLKQNCNANSAFQDSLSTSTRFTEEQICAYSNPAISGVVTPSTTGTNGSVDASIAGGQAPLEYNWSNGSTSEDISGLGAGSFTLTVTDDYGCTTSELFTVGGVTGTLSYENNYTVQVYPNPSTSSFVLNTNYPQMVNIRIMDLQGKVITNENNMTGTINIGHTLQAGTYIVHITSPDKQLNKQIRVVKL